MSPSDLRRLHLAGLVLVGLLAVVLAWGCTPRLPTLTPPPALPDPVAPLAARTERLTQRGDVLRTDLDQARDAAAQAAAEANAAESRGDPAAAAEARHRAALAAARADALREALAANDAEAAKAREEWDRAATAARDRYAADRKQEQDEQAAALEKAEKAKDRRWCWWIGAAGAGLGVVAGFIGHRLGLGLAPGSALAAGGLAVATYGQAAAWALPALASLAILALAALVWRQREALLRAAAEWATYAEAVPPHQRRKLDEESRQRQGRSANALDRALDRALGRVPL